MTRTPLDDDFAFEMDYEDASGRITRRTVLARYLEKEGDIYRLGAICHLRGGLRSFRLDRIHCVIDENGEVHPPGQTIATIMELAHAAPQTPQPARTPRPTPAPKPPAKTRTPTRTFDGRPVEHTAHHRAKLIGRLLLVAIAMPFIVAIAAALTR